jgi:D-alanine transaminase
MMKDLAYYNGEIGGLDEVKVPFLDRSHWFGDGVYDAAYSTNGVVFLLGEHVERFLNSARLIGIELAEGKEELVSLIASLDAKVEGLHHMVYFQATRGTAPRAHAFPDGPARPNLWAMIWPVTPLDRVARVGVVTEEDTRFFHCNVKTINLLPNVLGAEKAKRAGAAECVFHRGERVTECAHSNVHILQGGALVTAPTDNLILPGITRAHLIRACRSLGVPVREEPFTVAQMLAADEVFLTSTVEIALSVGTVDGAPVGGKDMALFRRIQGAMLEEYYEATGWRP